MTYVVLVSSCNKDDLDPDNPTNGKTTAVFNKSVTYGKMTDQEGNTYKTVTIGTQTWMAENLRTTKYNDGTPIPYATDPVEWQDAAYCNINNTTSLDTIATYGRLYNWFAVETGKLSPVGWHVPTKEEFDELINYLAGFHFASRKLRESGTTHWQFSNEATNETGFTALPGGYGTYYNFFGFGFYCIWWSATNEGNAYGWDYTIDANEEAMIMRSGTSSKHLRFSVRCVKD